MAEPVVLDRVEFTAATTAPPPGPGEQLALMAGLAALLGVVGMMLPAASRITKRRK